MELVLKAIESELWSKNNRIEWLEKEKRELLETKEQLEAENEALRKGLEILKEELQFYKPQPTEATEEEDDF